MKLLSDKQLFTLFTSLEPTWDVRLPVCLPDGTRALGTLADGPPALLGGSLPAKPTAIFFPQEEQIFTASKGKVHSPALHERPLFVAGFTSSDLACLRFIDRFFADEPQDDLYFRRRQTALVAAITGWCGPGGSFMKMTGGACDLEFVRDAEGWLLISHSERGKQAAKEIPDNDNQQRVEALLQVSATLVDNDDLLQRASALLRAERVPDQFWNEIGDRCILCTGCNLVCPTCTCFGLRDWRYTAQVERTRIWDSCQLEGFMREAGGHNPLGTEASRSRRRVHHKLAADLLRWGEISCFLCGRCDATCPTGIGIIAIMREMVVRYG